MRTVRWSSRLLLPLFLLVLTTVYVAATFQITPQFSEGFVGPRFMPLLAALLMYAALAHIIWSERSSDNVSEAGSLWQPAAVVLATALYIAVFKPLGYTIATFAYVVCLFHIFHYQAGRPLRRLLNAIAVTAVFYGLFALVFGIRLPAFQGII